MSGVALSLVLFAVVSLSLILTGILRRPGIGILISLAAIAGFTWYRRNGLLYLGFKPQSSWIETVLLALLLGIAIGLLSLFLLEPAIERITGEPHDYSVVGEIRGNPAALLKWLFLVWLLVALVEEIIFRGFLMGELAALLGTSVPAFIATLIIASVVFGLAHWYQGPSGALSATLVGIVIGAIFIISAFNLWLVVLIHGFIDSVELVLMYANMDQKVRQILF